MWLFDCNIYLNKQFNQLYIFFVLNFVQNASIYIRPDLDLKIKPLYPGSVSSITFFLADVLADFAYLTDNKETRPLTMSAYSAYYLLPMGFDWSVLDS